MDDKDLRQRSNSQEAMAKALREGDCEEVLARWREGALASAGADLKAAQEGEAARWCQGGLVEKIISLAALDPEIEPQVARWALDLAFFAGDEQACALALDRCQDVGDMGLILQGAINVSWEGVARALWEKGAPTTPSGLTQAMCAAIFDWDPSWRDWARGCDPGLSDERGWTAAHFAAHHGRPRALRLLAPLGGLELENDNGRTPFEEAARGGDAECVAILADAGPFKPDGAVWQSASSLARTLADLLGVEGPLRELRQRELAWGQRAELDVHLKPAPARRKPGL